MQVATVPVIFFVYCISNDTIKFPVYFYDSGKETKPLPNYIADRQVLWDKLKKQYDDEVAAKTKDPITITLPDGKTVDGKSIHVVLSSFMRVAKITFHLYKLSFR